MIPECPGCNRPLPTEMRHDTRGGQPVIYPTLARCVVFYKGAHYCNQNCLTQAFIKRAIRKGREAHAANNR